MTRVPVGNRSSRYPSPCQSRVGGVDRSTSRTKPGRGTASNLLRRRAATRAWAPGPTLVEHDLDGAASTGVGRVVDGVDVAVERVGGGHQPMEPGGVHEREGPPEGAPG